MTVGFSEAMSTRSAMAPQMQGADPDDEDEEEGPPEQGPSPVLPLTESELNEALSKGPVFVAFLHHVKAKRAEVLATLHAAAMNFIVQLAQPPEPEDHQRRRVVHVCEGRLANATRLAIRPLAEGREKRNRRSSRDRKVRA